MSCRGVTGWLQTSPLPGIMVLDSGHQKGDVGVAPSLLYPITLVPTTPGLVNLETLLPQGRTHHLGPVHRSWDPGPSDSSWS